MSVLSPLGRRVRRNRRQRMVLETATVREFDGGWNVIDNDLNLSPKFAKTSKNMYRAADGSVALRFGTSWFADIEGVINGTILDFWYYANYLIVATTDGELASVSSTGVVTAIWNSTIAAALTGSPSGWSTGLTFVAATQFKGELIVCNGIDKPLIIDSSISVQYLQDPTSGNNINTPIAKYVTSVQQWVVMGGITGEEGIIYISSTQTSGVWPNDAAPNDSTSFQVGSAVTSGAGTIVGLAAFRNKLVVAFADVVVIVALGDVSTGTHVPVIEDILPQFGTVSHRTMQNLGDDLLFADIVGVPSLIQSQLSGSLEPRRVSELIDPEIQDSVAALATTTQNERMFSVYHRLEQQYLLFVPDADTYAATTETRCFAYKHTQGNPQPKRKTWADYRGWNWRAACRSDLGRVFFATDKRIFRMGDERFNDIIYLDKIGDRDGTWAVSTAYTEDQIIRDTTDDTYWTCEVGHTSGTASFPKDREDNPTYWTQYHGVAIDFDYEFPWADFKDRMKTKTLRYISFDTLGDARFTFEVYVDNYVFDQSDGDTRIPAISMGFVAGESGGFGAGPQPYGGGRRAIDERPWGVGAKFKIMKMRFSGCCPLTTKGIKIVAISVGYAMGTVIR